MRLYWGCPSIVWARRSRAVGSLISGTWFPLSPVATSEGAGCQECISHLGCLRHGHSLLKLHPGLGVRRKSESYGSECHVRA